MDDFEEIFAAYEALNNLAEIEENEHHRRAFRGKDPFQYLSEEQFIKHFRLSKDLTRELIGILTPHITPPTRPTALTVDKKVLVALKLYGYGSYQEITGSNMYTGVSQPSVSRCMEEVTDALNRQDIFNEWVKFPANVEELRALRARFYTKYQLPGVVGCVDCTHVAIVPPRGDDNHPEHIYVNRKGYHSINVQLTCDEKLRILHINSRFPGSTHDAHIWRESNLSVTMERIYRRYPEDNFFLLGDSGYPLRPWLMTPLREIPDPGTPEERFNNALKTARSTIERCNGTFKNRFRCLLKDRVLHYNPLKASKIINACAVLHNMCIERNVPLLDDEAVPHMDGLNIDREIDEHHRNDDLMMARDLQRSIINNHFT